MLSTLEKIDIFGVGINIMFNQQSKHRTRFGGFITIIIVTLLSLLFLSSIKQMIYKTNPQVIYEQQLVSNPSRYDLQTDNFSFMVSLLDQNFNPIYDESIYRIEASFLYKEPSINPDGSEGPSAFKNQVIQMELCTEKHFQVENARDYFLNLPYQQMHCFKNIDDLYLVGQFEMDIFSVINISVIACDENDPENKVQCLEKTKRDQILSLSSLQVYYTTQIVQVSNHQQPFSSIGTSYFWETNIDFLQNISLLFIKTYIEDNQGLILDDIKLQNSLLFSSERMMMSSKKDFSIYKIGIYLEKNKEQKYSRKYLKISEAFSQVGGIFNVLFMIGCIIAQPYSQMQLNRKLFNSTFLINKDFFGNSGSNIQIGGSDKSPPIKKGEQDSSKQSQFLFNQKKPSQILTKKQSQVTANQNQDLQTKKSSFIETKQEKDSKQQQNQTNDNNFLGIIKTQFNDLKISTKEYFLFYFNCFKWYKSQTLEMIQYGSQQVLNYIDICFLINKSIELEKFKRVMLNEQQIKLFDFIPKPSIDYQLLQQMHSRDQTKMAKKTQLQLNSKNKVNSQEDQFTINNLENKINKNKMQFNILSVQNKSFIDKAKEAQLAFNHIYRNKENQSKIDLKLIQMLDDKLVQLLDVNGFDESTVGAGTKLQLNNQFSKSKFRNLITNSNNLKIDLFSEQSLILNNPPQEPQNRQSNENKDENQQDRQSYIVLDNMEVLSLNQDGTSSKYETSEINLKGIHKFQREQTKFLISQLPTTKCNLRSSTVL
ncbi:ubiquitin-conjugating enzyme family protein (macronuclear) [Tetrahymena thermophila SB210]|uniref:Ubiquitin-conjugating enzyme family protein n=1 Tax=Tetrahymena thermophila (strain SB210) TaxID=312017 RepID=I7M383_TETTS|nr:ubiquitin-conjugating enzyme family protein [Tetrahymena thermophila SB210]EAS02653.2 ubiquitin-conjugating enzyme family protein [Tetrahymena thermophila SB210]|eukprot:XP_001022898.2 ubiquitin-conjugating enzyme family protein [Tetrahymena thermophila SB210]